MEADQLRDRFARMLLQQVQKDNYPSPAALEILDQLPGKTRNAFVSLLLEKIEGDAYPSPEMLRRVSRLLSSA